MIAVFKLHTTKQGRKYYVATVEGYGSSTEFPTATREKIFSLMSQWLKEVAMTCECNRIDNLKNS
jgi:hypothetical protein